MQFAPARLPEALARQDYRRISSRVWAAGFRYLPDGGPGPRRFVLIRRAVPEEPSAQLYLLQMGGSSYLSDQLGAKATAPMALLPAARRRGID